MPEGQQAGKPQQQVERAGEKRVTHDLHDEDRVHPQKGKSGHHDGQYRIAQELTIHFSFPNSPAGRINRTMAMMMNTTVLEASGQKTLVRPSITPSPRPVRMAPRMDPMPPITTTAKNTMIRLEIGRAHV